MTPRKGRFLSMACGFSLAAISVAVAQVPQPLLEYHLDETGSLCVSVGSSMLPLTLLDANGAPADLHSPDAAGITGAVGDRAFDNTSATAMGGTGVGGLALVSSNFVNAGAFSSFTLQCWFNASSPLVNGARLFDAGNYAVFAGRHPGAVWFAINHIGTGTAPGAFSQTNEWVFFAVSYDGTRTSNNVVFYTGTKDSPVVQLGPVGTVNAGVVTNRHAMGLGNLFYANVRPFRGRMDDVRIFAAGSGSAGVLDVAQLESLRETDIHRVQPVAGNLTTSAATMNSVVGVPVRVDRFQHNATGFHLGIQTVANVNYSVLWSTNLLDWQTLTNFTGDGGVVTVHDTNGRPRAFYRVLGQ